MRSRLTRFLRRTPIDLFLAVGLSLLLWKLA